MQIPSCKFQQGKQVTTIVGLINIAPIASEHILGFWRVLDVVARERKYLLLTEAPPIKAMRQSVTSNLALGNPQFVALVAGEVVGWCDICRDSVPVNAHCGSLGIGLLPAFRGQGIGRRLLNATLETADREGFVRVELTAHAENLNAISLYERTGFITEGVKRDAILLSGRYSDCVLMVRMNDENRTKLANETLASA